MESDIYEQSYCLEEKHWWYSSRRAIILYFFELYRDSSLSARLLDAGCGTGYTLTLLSRYGNAFGVDVSDDAVQLSQKRNLMRLQFASLDRLPFKSGSFDWVFSLDTIEHLENDAEVLAEFHRVCKKYGYIFLCVPAHRFLWSGEDIVSHHKRRYSNKSFAALINSADLRIKKITHFNFILFPFIMMVILIRNVLGRHDSSVSRAPDLINNIFRLIFLSEKTFLRYFNMPFGVSIMCIAQKR